MKQDIITDHFPDIDSWKRDKLLAIQQIYSGWNNLINVISRKDMDNFMIHHVLHSLSIAKIFSFKPGTSILDVGTGGGFPGIPLAILFPETKFFLLDSTGKKLKVVNAVAEELKLVNVTTINKRVEDEKGKYDFVTGRAVTEFTAFVKLTEGKLTGKGNPASEGGIIYLKGGDIMKEAGRFSASIKTWEIKDFFNEPYFETKKIVWLPAGFL